MSENTVLFALYRMGYHSRATTHGFRSTASTILNESRLWRADAIERQLALRWSPFPGQICGGSVWTKHCTAGEGGLSVHHRHSRHRK